MGRDAAKKIPAADSSRAQKRKNATGKQGVSLSAKRQAVAAAFQGAELLPASVREMLASMVPRCLPVEHPYQQELLGFATDTLRGVEGSLLAKVTEAEAAAATMAQQASELKRVDEFASRELSQSVKALAAEEDTLRSASAVLHNAKEDLKKFEKELMSCDVLIGTAAMERHQLEAMTSDPASVNSELLAKLFPDSKPKDTVGMIGQINAAIRSRDQAIRDAAALRVNLHTSIETARLACSDATTQLQSAKAARDKASGTRHACAEQMKSAWDAARDLPMQQAKADADVKASRANLEALQNGPLAFVLQAAEGATTTASQNKPVENRRMSFADIRRRRTSFVSRKRVASFGEDGAEKLEKGSISDTSKQPKEASDCRSGGA